MSTMLTYWPARPAGARITADASRKGRNGRSEPRMGGASTEQGTHVGAGAAEAGSRSPDIACRGALRPDRAPLLRLSRFRRRGRSRARRLSASAARITASCISSTACPASPSPSCSTSCASPSRASTACCRTSSRAGFVEQRTGVADRRRRLLVTTRRGEDLARELARVQSERIAQALAEAGEDTRRR